MPRIGRVAAAVLVPMVLVVSACSAGDDPILVAGGGGAIDERPTIQVVPGDDEALETVMVGTTEPTTPVVPTTTPPPVAPLVVFDTDMGPDVDDVLALAMLHSYEKRGLIELAAVTVSRDSTRGAQYADAVNTFYGRPDIPIGVFRGGTVKQFDDNITFVSIADSWPQDIAANPIPDGFRVQRQVLAGAAAEGRDVIIVQTGFSGNVSALLDSQADEVSDRTGIELVDQHVSLLSVMAGATQSSFVEFNVGNDLTSARNLFAKWPGQLALSPFELGNALHYPYASITRDFGWTERHPVREAYEFRDLSWHKDAPPFYDMKAWDLTSVMFAIEPEADYFGTSQPGRVVVDETGVTTFQPGDGRHVVLDTPDGQADLVLDRMIQLVSDQP